MELSFKRTSKPLYHFHVQFTHTQKINMKDEIKRECARKQTTKEIRNER